MRTLKILFFIPFIVFFLSLPAYCASMDELNGAFNAANELYKQGKYQDAVNEYGKIVSTGYESGPLYYNMGNCYFKLGNIGQTVLYYEKAKRFTPNDPELKANYNYVQSQLKDKILSPRKSFIKKKIGDIAESMPFERWIAGIIALWGIFVVLALINIFARNLTRIFKYFYIFLLTVFVISAVCAVLQYNIISSPAGIILKKEVPVRYGPDESEVEAFILHEGTKVTIKNTQIGWCQIQVADGKSGWIPKDSVGII